MTCCQNWTFREGELDREDVRALLALHFAEMRGGSPPSACHVLPAEGLERPDIRVFTLRDEAGVLLGCGALRRLDQRHGEIKSMRTVPASLGRGVGRAILRHIVEQARAQGLSRLSLETGSGDLFAAALRLYSSAGFAPCGPFAGYRPSPFTRFFTREI